MPTTLKTDTPPDDTEIIRQVRRDRLRAAEGVFLDAEAKLIEAKDAALRRLRKLHPTAPPAVIGAWLQIDHQVMKADQLVHAAKWDMGLIERGKSITPSRTERRAAIATCESRRRSWARFTRQLDHQVSRRRRVSTSTNLVGTGRTGRSARRSTSTRTRGSRRASTSTAGSGGGDSGSGDSDPSGLAQTGRATENEHEERRYCRGCGLRLIGYLPQARDHGPACTTRWRRRGKVDAPWVDGIKYGPGCSTQAEIEEAIRVHRETRYLHEQVTSDSTLEDVLELIELAVDAGRVARAESDRTKARAVEYDLARLWHEIRLRRDDDGTPVYRAGSRRLRA